MRKRRKKPWHLNPFFLGLLVVVLTVLIHSTYSSFLKRKEAQQAYASYKEEFNRLQAKKLELEAEIKDLSTPRGREEEYRQRYNVVRDGEQLIRIVESQ